MEKFKNDQPPKTKPKIVKRMTGDSTKSPPIKTSIFNKIKSFVEEKPFIAALIMAVITIIVYLLIPKQRAEAEGQLSEPIVVPPPSHLGGFSPQQTPQRQTTSPGETPAWVNTIKDGFDKMNTRMNNIVEQLNAEGRDVTSLRGLIEELQEKANIPTQDEPVVVNELANRIRDEMARVEVARNNPDSIAHFDRVWGGIDNYLSSLADRYRDATNPGSTPMRNATSAEIKADIARVTANRNNPGTIRYLTERFGSVDAYLQSQSNRLRNALRGEDATVQPQTVSHTPSAVQPQRPTQTVSHTPRAVQPQRPTQTVSPPPNVAVSNQSTIDRLRADIARIEANRNNPATINYLTRNFGSVANYLASQQNRLQQALRGN